MSLPYDYSRCAGTTHPTCQHCRRREPGRAEWQAFIQPPIDMMAGTCGEFIEPRPVVVTSNAGGLPLGAAP